MPKATITRAEYQQLLGLAILARDHNRSLREICTAAESIVGENPNDSMAGTSHCSDMIYGTDDVDVDRLLRVKLKITIAD